MVVLTTLTAATIFQEHCDITLFAVKSSNKLNCYVASAETKRDWLIHGHVALDKCNVSLGQQVNNCCPLRPAPYINKQNGDETRKFINSDFRAFCLKKYTIGREDMLLKLKFNYSSKFWLFWTCKYLVYAIEFSIYCHDIVK